MDQTGIIPLRNSLIKLVAGAKKVSVPPVFLPSGGGYSTAFATFDYDTVNKTYALQPDYANFAYRSAIMDMNNHAIIYFVIVDSSINNYLVKYDTSKMAEVWRVNTGLGSLYQSGFAQDANNLYQIYNGDYYVYSFSKADGSHVKTTYQDPYNFGGSAFGNMSSPSHMFLFNSSYLFEFVPGSGLIQIGKESNGGGIYKIWYDWYTDTYFGRRWDASGIPGYLSVLVEGSWAVQTDIFTDAGVEPTDLQFTKDHLFFATTKPSSHDAIFKIARSDYSATEIYNRGATQSGIALYDLQYNTADKTLLFVAGADNKLYVIDE
ncbi:MAG TPA: hypothetical protein VE870_03690, partial [Bacteroidales bacterium]|nr:hypothetical protein [Bacteroidales bacterium]